MVDTFSRRQRSKIMRAVRSSGTSPEKTCEHLMQIARIRYRKHPKNLPGHPDFILPNVGVAVFVHGCFWHGHKGCEHSSLPSSNVKYWTEKIGRNQRRDRRVLRWLRKAGWRTAVLWECKLWNSESITRRLLKLSQPLSGGKKLR
jgi:DNA mismatch endonuclease (patch repair protein)